MSARPSITCPEGQGDPSNAICGCRSGGGGFIKAYMQSEIVMNASEGCYEATLDDLRARNNALERRKFSTLSVHGRGREGRVSEPAQSTDLSQLDLAWRTPHLLTLLYATQHQAALLPL